jgi:excisionase family DNA binding protein
MKTAARILGIPFMAVRRLIAEDQLPAIRAGRGGKFMIARTAIVKYAERIK